ncbi:MAG TPA: hypothetical protein VIK37_03525 [Candidatus Saccharimonadales bacterium]
MADEAGKESPRTKPPETPPPIITQTPTRGEGRQWMMLLIYMVIALIVAAGVVLGGRWVYNQVRNNEPAKVTTPTSNRATETPAATGGQSGTSSQEPPSQPSPTPTPSPSTQGSQIANTGPGEVVAIFVTATLTAAGLHYIYQLRRAIN